MAPIDNLATVQNFTADTASEVAEVIDRLKEMSPDNDIIALMCQLGPNISESDQTEIENQIQHKYEAALRDRVPQGMLHELSLMLAHTSVADVHAVLCHSCASSSQGNSLLFDWNDNHIDGLRFDGK